MRRPRRLAAVFAHPDDDAYLLGGWLALHAPKTEVAIVLCTSGGAGPISDPSLATRETLAGVREGEERRFLDEVGAAHAEVTFLRYPDYFLNEVDLAELTARVAETIGPAQPEVVVTFGPEGVTNHHDHRAAGAAATTAFHELRRGAAPGAFERLYHAAIPASSIDTFYRTIDERHPDFGGRDDLFNPTGVPDEQIAVRVDARPVARPKLAGILAHATQLTELTRIPEELRWIYLDDECFVRAWPPRDPGEPVAPDLFDGASA